MSSPSTAFELKIVALCCLAGALIACIGLLTLIDHFQRNHVPYKEVKLFGVLAHLCLFLLTLTAGTMMNSSIFVESHQKYNIITIPNCKYMTISVSGFGFIARYFMNAFSISRLRYFFDSTSLALNKRIYYGWLISFAIFVFLLLMFIFLTTEPIILTAIDNEKLKKCQPDSTTMNIYLFYLAVVEGFMQCILLYLYHRKYQQFQLVHCVENVDDKYVKKHVVKRSLFLGMIAIISSWICACMIVMKSPLFYVIGIVISFIIQICTILFSFDICRDIRAHNGGVELANVGNNGLNNRDNEEYLSQVMDLYYQQPGRSRYIQSMS